MLTDLKITVEYFSLLVSANTALLNPRASPAFEVFEEVFELCSVPSHDKADYIIGSKLIIKNNRVIIPYRV